ncbi:MAG: hypothetical protein IJI14_08510 [Anaerolineaceae bacterium]|nr:hypothetical protein [Flexilinea sp.]MBQ6518748.1 hypothetical protein [Anaerolineaceae bacterium]
MAEAEKNAKSDELRVNVEKLSEQELEDLALLVTRKLHESMRRERDRAGRL